MEYQEVTLETLNKGAAKELFQESLQRIIANINDLNVSAEFERQIKLTVTFAPNKDRQTIITYVDVATKLAPVREHQDTMFLAFHGNKQKALVHNVNQPELPLPEYRKQTPKSLNQD